MSQVAIAYIGPKAVKRDTVTGSRQVFPRMTPIDVSAELAAVLLCYDQVFVEASALDAVREAENARQAQAAKSREEAEAAHKKRQAAADMSVSVDGKTFDLAKMTSPQIATLVEGAELAIPAKGAQESAADYKRRVRDAIRDEPRNHGTP